MTNLYKVIVDEVTRNGGPTDKCCRIFDQTKRRGGTSISREEYWAAVREGTTRHRWQNKVKRYQ